MIDEEKNLPNLKQTKKSQNSGGLVVERWVVFPKLLETELKCMKARGIAINDLNIQIQMEYP